MNKKNIISLVIVILALIALYFYFSQKENKYLAVNSWEECLKAGYPILESYPEQCKTPDNRTFVNPDQKASPPIVVATSTATTTATSTATGTPPHAKDNLIKVNNVSANQIISSPLIVTGEARGTWFFEASFPVEILDANGKQLVIKPAQAQGEWMTEKFVPFSVSLVFDKPVTETGMLILHKDNPSGEPSRDDSLSIPVRFK